MTCKFVKCSILKQINNNTKKKKGTAQGGRWAVQYAHGGYIPDSAALAVSASMSLWFLWQEWASFLGTVIGGILLPQDHLAESSPSC